MGLTRGSPVGVQVPCRAEPGTAVPEEARDSERGAHSHLGSRALFTVTTLENELPQIQTALQLASLASPQGPPAGTGLCLAPTICIARLRTGEPGPLPSAGRPDLCEMTLCMGSILHVTVTSCPSSLPSIPPWAAMGGVRRGRDPLGPMLQPWENGQS